MTLAQPAILADVPRIAHFTTFALQPAASARAVLDALGKLRMDGTVTVGIGEPLARALGATVPGLTTFAAMSGPGVGVPSTQGALWLQTRGDDPGVSLHATGRVLAALGAHVRVEESIAAFKHDVGRDLSGFEDGTENPKGDAAVAAALRPDGSSFAAVQRWVHDLVRLETLEPRMQNELIGRDRTSNDELADAPPFAHIKRSQQEAFEPPAFMVRRSMPYGGLSEHGLYFIAYVATLDTFERVMRRMTGADDGIADGLFQFSRPVTGGYFWCPPVVDGRLDLRALTPRPA